MVTMMFFYMTLLGITMVLLFVGSRLSRWKTLLIVYGFTALAMAAEIVLIRFWGTDTLSRVYILIVHLPALLLFYFIGYYRGWALIFQFLSAMLFCALIQQGAGLAYYLFGNRLWVIVAAYLLFTAAVLWFLLGYLRPLIAGVLLEIQQGLWSMCLVIAIYWLITVYMVPGYVGLDPSSTAFKPILSLLMVGFYVVVITLFSTAQREAESRHNAQISALSLHALETQIEAIHGMEEAVRVERHDLRHRLQTVAELIREGKQQEALHFIGAAQQRLDDQKPAVWCRPPILNAVFSSYFQQAERQGIRISAHIALPQRLPVEEGELAVVFANALENAIHACCGLPREKREICCKVLAHPGLMFEISNPCGEAVRLDSQGLPVPSQNGHGTGTRSIAAFCKKHGALWTYTVTEGRFSIRVIL